MGLFTFVFVLEVWPMSTFIRWRLAIVAGRDPDVTKAGIFARLNDMEVVLVVAIVFVAAMMSRGLWLLP